MDQDRRPKLIAFYLPQYHPIPENDTWWGKGFTEWTNVAKAKPLFKGHYQPHIPADLGFYDLRVPETRQAQADMAMEYGIEGFCYWHYWFAGKRLLERPINEVLQSGQPDFPFCLAWANQSWTGIWHGAPDRVLIKQTYPGKEDHVAHFNNLLPAFLDRRYIMVDGKPLFLIYKPKYLPEPNKTLSLWRELAIKAGLSGLFIVGVINDQHEGALSKFREFDAFTLSRLAWPSKEKHNLLLNLLFKVFGKSRAIRQYQRLFNRPYHVYDFKKVAKQNIIQSNLVYKYFPCVVSNWDNTPRSGLDGYVGVNCTPELFKQQLDLAFNRVDGYPVQQKIVFIKSWNEWAEGNYLEPDLKFGRGYLQALQDALKDHMDAIHD